MTSPALTPEQAALSDVVVFSKYSRYLPEQRRRETWDEVVDRHREHFRNEYRDRVEPTHWPAFEAELERVYEDFVRPKRVLPSMRGMQFAGRALDLSPVRAYNCSYSPVKDIEIFREAMFLLLSGVGFGYSVQRRHTQQLPVVRPPKRRYRYRIQDTLEGWADAVHALVDAYLGSCEFLPAFDYRDIRPQGAPLRTTGGRAPGPEPLRKTLEAIAGVFERTPFGYHLQPIDVHDILCHLAEAVYAGGIRRAAMIALFDADDEAMLSAKAGAWWEDNPQRARANNSVVLHRVDHDEADFRRVWERVRASGAGEPGILWTSDYDVGTNPCSEVSLEPYMQCNLTEINASTITNQADLEARASAAAFIGTLQAGLTDFHYLRPVWREVAERSALLGVSATGIASGNFTRFDLETAADVVRVTNERIARVIGINPAHRLTTVKPAGTTSAVLGTSSGIHAWHAPYYLRRVRLNKHEALYTYLRENHPQVLEEDVRDPNNALLVVPQRAPEGAITRDETALELLDRVRDVYERWVVPGHVEGVNTNNISCSVTVRENEWDDVGDWMWKNRECYAGLSVIPHNGGSYVQMPFEDISEDEYHVRMRNFPTIDLSRVVEAEDGTDLVAALACGANGCEVTQA